MQKVSATAAKATRSIGEQKLTIGLDPGTHSCEFDLTPGKAEGFGFISSFVYLRAILLTPLPKAKLGQ